jgi:Zn-finger nucleic acid-binding protein
MGYKVVCKCGHVVFVSSKEEVEIGKCPNCEKELSSGKVEEVM